MHPFYEVHGMSALCDGHKIMFSLLHQNYWTDFIEILCLDQWQTLVDMVMNLQVP